MYFLDCWPVFLQAPYWGPCLRQTEGKGKKIKKIVKKLTISPLPSLSTKLYSMRSLKLTLAVAVVLLAATACQQTGRKQPEPIVSVSIIPLQFFIDQLTDGALEVNVMVPPGASHATYSPTTSQFRRLSDSGLYFRIGHLGYEQAWIGRLSELNPTMKVVNLSGGLELIRGEEIDHGDHVHEGGIDPHIWMSPSVMLKLLPTMRDAILEIYPELSETVQTRYEELQAELLSVHRAMEMVTSDLDQRTFMIFHPALTYLARDYGLEQVSIERGGKDPTPAQLSRIIREARTHQVPLIFIQEEFDVRSAQLVSEESGATLVQINPMAYDWIDEMHRLMGLFKEYLQ